jgi:hypothetical protein
MSTTPTKPVTTEAFALTSANAPATDRKCYHGKSFDHDNQWWAAVQLRAIDKVSIHVDDVAELLSCHIVGNKLKFFLRSPVSTATVQRTASGEDVVMVTTKKQGIPDKLVFAYSRV